MANLDKVRETKRVIVEDLGGKDRVLRYDLNAFAEMENRFGSVQNAMAAMQASSMKHMKTIIWIGLIHEEAIFDEETGEPIKFNITPYQVGSWIEPSRMPEMSEKVMEAMGISMPDVENMPGVKEQLAEQGLAIVDGKIQQATVVLTPEEIAIKEAEEVKNV